MMHPSQARSLKRIEHFLQEQLDENSVEKYGQAITEFEVTDHEFFQSVSAKIELTGLEDGNLLKFVDHRYFHFHIMKRGSIKVCNYPESFDQFAGQKRYFGMEFRKKG